MATESPAIYEGTNIAGADLSAKQFFAVVQSTAADRTMLLASAATGITGILQNTPKSGEACSVAIFGVSKAQIGTGGVTRGDALQVEAASGKLITKAAGVQVAVAEESCAAGAVGTVRLIGPTA